MCQIFYNKYYILVMTNDILIVNSQIDLQLYNDIITTIVDKNKTPILDFILITNGGDPHSAYKIAKFLQNKYAEGYRQIIINRCKSAGTLITCGAKEIVFDKYRGELGPLDVQRISNDDLQAKQISTLNLFQTIEYISKKSVELFFKNFVMLRQSGLSIKSASEVCCDIIKSIYEPICRQIEPNAIGEFSRNLEIMRDYLTMLNKKYNNTKNGDKLISGYPDHNFVIDYEEAKIIFQNLIELDNATINMYNSSINNMQGKLLFTPYDSK